MYDVTLLDFISYFSGSKKVFGGVIQRSADQLEGFILNLLIEFKDVDFIINNYQFNIGKMYNKLYCATIRNDSTGGVITKPDDMSMIDFIKMYADKE